MSQTITNYSVYDLSNPHFKNVEILTSKNTTLKGQFVKFKVFSGNVVYLYPGEKSCFLPLDKSKQFWDEYNSCNGEFKKFPDYIMKLGLNDILKITIEPILIA